MAAASGTKCLDADVASLYMNVVRAETGAATPMAVARRRVLGPAKEAALAKERLAARSATPVDFVLHSRQ
jgi:hypothetical protein